MEWADVFGNYYGTLWSEVEQIYQGIDVVTDLDVQGVQKIRESGRIPMHNLCDVFILPPSLAELKDRLIGRGDTVGDALDTRLGKAKWEMDQASAYKYVIVNDTLRKTRKLFRRLIERHRTLAATSFAQTV